MSLTMSRRSALAGFLSALAAPAVVKADMLMPIKMWRYGPRPVVLADGILLCNGAEVERAAYPELFRRMGTRFGDGDGRFTFLIPSVPARGFSGQVSPMGLVAKEGVKSTALPFGVGSGFDINSNLLRAEMEDYPDRKIEWTPKARMLIQESGGSLGYVKPDLRPYELGAVEDSVRAYARGYAHSGTKMMEYDRKYIISRVMYDHSLPSLPTYAEKISAIESIVDRYL